MPWLSMIFSENRCTLFGIMHPEKLQTFGRDHATAQTME